MAKNTSILLGDYYEAFVAEKVQSGRYSSASELIRNALRLMEDEEKKRQALIDAIEKGENSGFVKGFNKDEFLKKVHKKAGLL
jgi:antitoxin ParD1/3/4